MGINFRELKTTIFRKNKLSRILQNRIFRGIKLSRICQNSRKSRKFLPHYFLPLKYLELFEINSHPLSMEHFSYVFLSCLIKASRRSAVETKCNIFSSIDETYIRRGKMGHRNYSVELVIFDDAQISHFILSNICLMFNGMIM